MKFPIVAFVLLVIFWLLTPVVTSIITDNPEGMGQLGDTFGSINALFSGLALGALVYTIYLQRKDLRNQQEQLEMQREDLRLQREEMEKSRGELEKQSKIQEARFNASISQLHAFASQAKIEGYKVESQDSNFGRHPDDCIKGIQEEAQKIKRLAKKLEEYKNRG